MERAFWCYHQPKSCPRKRGKCRGVAVTKGERLGDAEHCEMFPLSFAYAQQLPHKWWRLLVRFINSHVKPALKGEVDASVTSRRRGCIEAVVVYVNPSVTAYAVPAPRPGSLLVRFTSSNKNPPLPREVDFAKQKTEGVSALPRLLHPLQKLLVRGEK